MLHLPFNLRMINKAILEEVMTLDSFKRMLKAILLNLIEANVVFYDWNST